MCGPESAEVKILVGTFIQGLFVKLNAQTGFDWYFRIITLYDGKIWPNAATFNDSMGTTAVVQIEDHITVVVTSLPSVQTDPKVFRLAGVDPVDYRLVLAKAVYQHSRLFGPIATDLVFISEGRADLNALPWKYKDPQKIFPFSEFTDTEIRSIIGLNG